MSNNNMLDTDIKQIVEDSTGSKFVVSGTLKLKGDASYRSYYRIFDESGRSYILMKWNPELTKKSEEAFRNQPIDEFPFINICNYLSGISIPVPSIYFQNIDRGLIILEDLGDTTLEIEFKKKIDYTLYEKAINLLAKLKNNSRKNPDNKCIAFLRKFDYDLYFWEFEHFIEYGIEARNNIKIPERDKNTIKNYFSDISRRLDASSNIFTHRDYQSRNIMIYNNELYLIDFQDALMGTIVYDLVALLRDSYISFDDKIVNDFIKLYFNNLIKYGFNLEYDSFVGQFFMQTIQRKLKDGGRFIFIDRVKKNPSFLPYVSTSFSYAREALKKFKDFKGLYNILSKYVPEFNN